MFYATDPEKPNNYPLTVLMETNCHRGCKLSPADRNYNAVKLNTGKSKRTRILQSLHNPLKQSLRSQNPLSFS